MVQKVALSSVRSHCEKYVAEKGSTTHRSRLCASSLTFGRCIEKDAVCRGVLNKTFEGIRCLFGDIEKLQNDSRGVKTTAYCFVHQRRCNVFNKNTDALHVWHLVCQGTCLDKQRTTNNACFVLGLFCLLDVAALLALACHASPNRKQKKCTPPPLSIC